eukprot:100391-Chlamydomonas_euryale.AAC.1
MSGQFVAWCFCSWKVQPPMSLQSVYEDAAGPLMGFLSSSYASWEHSMISRMCCPVPVVLHSDDDD